MTKNAAPPQLTLVVGNEALLAERAVDDVVRLARRIDADTERREIDATEPGAAGAIAEACSPTLFGGGAVVVINRSESADDKCVAAIADFVAHNDSGASMVVVHAGGARGKKQLARFAELANAQVACPEIKKGRGVADFVAAEMRRNRRKMSPDAQALLIAAVGSDARGLAAACSQLASDVEGDQISAAAVGEYFGGTVEVTGFQIADAALNKHSAQALRLLRLAEGTDGARLGPATVSALAGGTRQVIALDSAPAGMSDRDLAEEARIPTWKLRTLRGQARQWRAVDLASVMLVLADVDAAMKGGLREGDQLDPVQKGLLIEQVVTKMGRK